MKEQQRADRLKIAFERWRLTCDGTVTDLARRLAGARTPASTRTLLHRYMAGKAQPPAKFLRAAAPVLGVRAQWLVDGEGTITLAEEQAAIRVLRASMAATADQAPPFRDRLWQVLYPERVAPVVAPFWEPVALELWRRRRLYYARRDAPAPTDDDIITSIGRALVAPLRAFGIDLAAMGGDNANDYIADMLTVLLQVAGHGEHDVGAPPPVFTRRPRKRPRLP